MEMSKKRGTPMYAYVNNRLEGNAPLTIDGLLPE
jgi:hypothetical protein